jgi:hypothetical protein
MQVIFLAESDPLSFGARPHARPSRCGRLRNWRGWLNPVQRNRQREAGRDEMDRREPLSARPACRDHAPRLRHPLRATAAVRVQQPRPSRRPEPLLRALTRALLRHANIAKIFAHPRSNPRNYAKQYLAGSCRAALAVPTPIMHGENYQSVDGCRTSRARSGCRLPPRLKGRRRLTSEATPQTDR